MTQTYRIETITDMLKVPADRRPAMLRDIETMLLMQDFVCGGDSPLAVIGAITWTDDGDPSVSILDDDDKPVLTLEITEQERT